MGKLIAIVAAAAIVYFLIRRNSQATQESRKPEGETPTPRNKPEQFRSAQEALEDETEEASDAKKPGQPVDHAKAQGELRQAMSNLERMKENDVISETAHQSPDQLLDRFIAAVEAGRPEVCTYAWAYSRMVDPDYGKWSQGFTVKTLNLAKQSAKKSCPGLGDVGLDTFIVSKGSGKPSGGHWADVTYSEGDWERVLGSAKRLGA